MSTTELYQLLKLPMLIEHFNEHSQLNQGTTFWSYLGMHYFNNDVKYADFDKDTKLPFKSHDESVNIVTLSFLQNTSICKIVNPFNRELKVNAFYKGIFLTSSYLSNIWQPPRAC